jgi:hypothetical protein
VERGKWREVSGEKDEPLPLYLLLQMIIWEIRRMTAFYGRIGTPSIIVTGVPVGIILVNVKPAD